MAPTNVAVIGAGVIGRTLATRFAQAGHRVTFGSRNPGNAELAELAGSIGAAVDSVADAIDGADVVVWAIGGSAMADAVPAVADRLDGKTVIDATNNVGAATINSLDVLARAAPAARLYRAFNSLGWENFADGHYGELTGDMLYSGPAETRETVEELIGATDLRPIWVGDNDKAKVVDDFVTLWFTLAFERGMGRNVGFKILTR
jgi:8-hydroxy-5-deazaflavin:NADPH oxidoreductase